MSKALGLALLVGAIYVGMTIYTEGSDQAFGGVLAGVFAPIEPLERDSLAASALTPAAQASGAPAGGAGRPGGKASDRMRSRFASER